MLFFSLSNPGFIRFLSFHSCIDCINSDNHFTICTRKENRAELLKEGHQVSSKWFIHVQRTLESFHGKTTDDHDTTRLPFRLFFYIRGRHFSYSSLILCPIYAYVNSNEIYELRINYALNVHRIINKLVIHRLLSFTMHASTVLFCCCSRWRNKFRIDENKIRIDVSTILQTLAIRSLYSFRLFYNYYTVSFHLTCNKRIFLISRIFRDFVSKQLIGLDIVSSNDLI